MFTRRLFLRNSALILGGLRVASSYGSNTSQPVTVKTPQWSLLGESSGGINIFRGVPFAQPPVGNLRFRSSQPSRPWEGVREALKFAPAAEQPGDSAVGKSEDCLYLNIWAPEASGPYPVMVWIHGGGFTGGRSSDPMQDGSHFAENGIVCITVAYRLGVFGFLDVEPMLGHNYGGAANNGLGDLITALEWVKQNVAAFGGDPGRVTIAGESAGAKLICTLMGVPSAEQLFQQAISESGGAERIAPESEALSVGQGFKAAWLTQTDATSSSMLDAPASQIIALQSRFLHDWPKHFPLRPEVDGKLLKQTPLSAIQSRTTRGKRLLIGTNRDESSFFIGPKPAEDPNAHDIGNMTTDQFQSIADGYRKLYPDMPADLRRIRSLTAEEYLVPSMRVADAHASGGGETFVYRLDFPGEGRFADLAFHSYDLRFVWDHFGQQNPPSDAKKLAMQMHGAWVSFIKTGVPTATDLPAWPAYTLQKAATMIFDSHCRIENAPEKNELALWNGVMTA
jgi:para-nitrobenzyl esterase